MVCFPNVKMNLGLNVVSKRPDDYHNIGTIFYPVPVRGAFGIVTSDQICFMQTRIPVDASREKNLVVKALNVLKTRYEIPPLKIYLLKVISFGAGFGGGSADTVFMLKLVNDFYGLDIHPDELEAVASTIGTDCSSFIRNTPVFAAGVRNQFEPVDLPSKGCYLCLAKPDVTVSTLEAYSMVTPVASETSLKGVIRLPVSEWKERMVNDFERSVFLKHPVIERIKDTLYEGGVLYVAMPGSGLSVFGLFEKPTHFRGQSLLSDCSLWEGRLL